MAFLTGRRLYQTERDELEADRSRVFVHVSVSGGGHVSEIAAKHRVMRDGSILEKGRRHGTLPAAKNFFPHVIKQRMQFSDGHAKLS
jgi:hypothetical protein